MGKIAARRYAARRALVNFVSFGALSVCVPILRNVRHARGDLEDLTGDAARRRRGDPLVSGFRIGSGFGSKERVLRPRSCGIINGRFHARHGYHLSGRGGRHWDGVRRVDTGGPADFLLIGGESRRNES